MQPDTTAMKAITLSQGEGYYQQFLDLAQKEVYHKIWDVYCYADPDKLTWDGSGDFHLNDKDTKIHVKADQLNKYKAKWSTGANTDTNATFVGDLDCPVLTDGEAYTRTIESKVNTATYQKTLGSECIGKHQAWLVPFDYIITSADLAKFWDSDATGIIALLNEKGEMSNGTPLTVASYRASPR